MEQSTEFDYETWWNEREQPAAPAPEAREGSDLEEEELESPAPPWVRLVSRRDPFPPCGALAIWPKNYTVGELADLSEDEEAEEDPARFVYSDAEMELWAQTVAHVLSGRHGAPFVASPAALPGVGA